MKGFPKRGPHLFGGGGGKFQEISFCKSVLFVGVATGKYGCCAANGYAAAAAAAVWRRLTGVGGADA